MKRMRIRPDQQGLRAALFDLEADIMEIVWERGGAEISVGDVHRVLEQSRDIAYTTVMTTVARLHEKELLSRRKEGKRYLYWPRLDRAAFERAVAKTLVSNFSREDTLALLVDRVAEGDFEELRRLEALIRKRRKELKS